MLRQLTQDISARSVHRPKANEAPLPLPSPSPPPVAPLPTSTPLHFFPTLHSLPLEVGSVKST